MAMLVTKMITACPHVNDTDRDHPTHNCPTPRHVEFLTDPEFRIPPWTPTARKSKKQLQREEYGTV